MNGPDLSAESVARAEAGYWRLQAACFGVPPERANWFPSRNEANRPEVIEAKRICSTCPVRSECLVFALVHGHVGIFGGLSGRERERVQRQLFRSGQMRYYRRCPGCGSTFETHRHAHRNDRREQVCAACKRKRKSAA